jgi:hypothetical protein
MAFLLISLAAFLENERFPAALDVGIVDVYCFLLHARIARSQMQLNFSFFHIHPRTAFSTFQT